MIRQPAVADMFYPADITQLQSMLAACFQQAKSAADIIPKAIIAPHAGYIYSGPVAASAYAYLKNLKGQVKTIVLLGPAHRVAVQGLALSTAEFFRTPLGDIRLDKSRQHKIQDLNFVNFNDLAHQNEHSLEVHLPFLKNVLGDFELIPVVVGEAGAGQVAEVMERLWAFPEVFFVISTDLSHYLSYDQARMIDQKTSQMIEQLNYKDIEYDQACGRNPVCGMLRFAEQRGLHVKNIDLRNSGDTAGPKDQVVGYGAYIIY